MMICVTDMKNVSSIVTNTLKHVYLCEKLLKV